MALPDTRPPLSEERIWSLFASAEEIAIRLEMVDRAFVWEAMPGAAHQQAVYAIQRSVDHLNSEGRDCACLHLADVYIAFATGSIKRPDLSIWCAEPTEREGFIHSVPEAVVEITSPGYEAKDLVEGPPLYLSAGVRDVIVLDRRTAEVHHWTQTGHTVSASPQELTLACGCRARV